MFWWFIILVGCKYYKNWVKVIKDSFSSPLCTNIQQRETHGSGCRVDVPAHQHNSQWGGMLPGFPHVLTIFTVMGKKKRKSWEMRENWYIFLKKKIIDTFSCFPSPFWERSVWCLLNSWQLKLRLCSGMGKVKMEGAALSAVCNTAPVKVWAFECSPGQTGKSGEGSYWSRRTHNKGNYGPVTLENGTAPCNNWL